MSWNTTSAKHFVWAALFWSRRGWNRLVLSVGSMIPKETLFYCSFLSKGWNGAHDDIRSGWMFALLSL
jgi:hypothetical protein